MKFEATVEVRKSAGGLEIVFDKWTNIGYGEKRRNISIAFVKDPVAVAEIKKAVLQFTGESVK